MRKLIRTAFLLMGMISIFMSAYAFADTLEVVENQITSSSLYETAPTLGDNGTTKVVVYTTRELLNTGFFDQGDIWYQQIDADGAPIGNPVQITSGTTDDKLNDVSGDYVVYTSYDNTMTSTGTLMLYRISTGVLQPVTDPLVIREPRIHGNTLVWVQGATGSTEVMLYDLAWLGTPQPAQSLAGPNPPVFNVDIGERFVVWVDDDGVDYDIGVYDLTTDQRIRLTYTSGIDERHPSTSGNWIVWESRDIGAPSKRIEAVNLANGDYRIVVDDGSAASRPSINGDIIAYESDTNNSFDIFLYRISTEETFSVMTEPNLSNEYLNDVYGDLVAYVRYIGSEIYMHDLSTGAQTPIIADEYGIYPSIYQEKIVWESIRNGNHEIYMYDISTGIESPITTDPAFQGNPSIYANTIVWQDDRNGNLDIYMYDISTGIESRITTDPADQWNPSIYANTIVWQDDRNGHNDIYMYDISSGVESRITTNTAGQGNPSIYANRIVWLDDRYGNYEIYMYDIFTGIVTRITTDPADQWNPSIYANTIVWQDDRYGNNDIYMYDISTGIESRITTDPADQWNPSIYANTIVWQDDRNGNLDIYRYDISTGIESRITTDPAGQWSPSIYANRIVWGDGRNSNAEDIYVSKFTFDMDEDGVGDNDDNCPDVANPDQFDFDGEGIGNACDLDLVNIPDPNLKARIELTLGVTDPTQADMYRLVSLGGISLDIVDLTGLEYGTNLRILSLINNLITNVSPLSGLTNLTSLSLHHNQISNISALAGLKKLHTLYLYENQISDLSALSGMAKNLTSLYLSRNQINDISPLSVLTNLTLLSLRDNQINDISALSGLIKLTSLSLGRNQISDISDLSSLTNLNTLALNENQITNISTLATLTNLTVLNLAVNQISNISALSNLTNLTGLQLYYNQISDISALSVLTNLTVLGLWDNQINDISILSNLTNLTDLSLYRNEISDISALSGLTNLAYLLLIQNPLNNNAYCNDIPTIVFNNPGIFITYDANPDSDGDGQLDACDSDDDNDGIFDEVDTAPTVFSNDFSDGDDFSDGIGYGTITDRGDQDFEITDLADPDGVRVISLAGTIPATVTACGGGAEVRSIDAGDLWIVNCTSVTVEVIAGSVDIEFFADDGTTSTVSLGAGNTLTFMPADSTLYAPSSNTDTVVVLVDGTELSLSPGETIALNDFDGPGGGMRITPIKGKRSGGPHQSGMIYAMDTVSTADQEYLATLVTNRRPAQPGELCKAPFPPPYPGAPCLVTEKVLLVYDITTDLDTLIGYKAYPLSGGSQPSAVEFVKLPNGQILVAVLEDYQLAFYDLTGQAFGEKAVLPQSFEFDHRQYYLDGYADFDVEYIDSEPLITVAGGVVIDDPSEAQSGLLVGVARDDAGNFVEKWREIIDCAGIITEIDSAAADGTITSALLCEEYVDENTVIDHVIVQSGSTLSFPGYSNIIYSDERIMSITKALKKKSMVTLVGFNTSREMVFYMSNKETPDGGVSPFITAIINGVPMAEITAAKGADPGVNVIGQDFFAIESTVYKLQPIVVLCGYATGRVEKSKTAYNGGKSDMVVAVLGFDQDMDVYNYHVVTLGGPGEDSITALKKEKDFIMKEKTVLFAGYVGSDHDLSVGPLSLQKVGGAPGGTDPFIMEMELTINVDIDIKPGSDPNCFNSDGHGVIPVAIFSTAGFDATQIDPSTISLDGQEVRVVGKGNTQAHAEDVNGDGLIDLMLQIEDIDGIYEEGSAIARLIGETFGGTPIEGTDSICIVP